MSDPDSAQQSRPQLFSARHLGKKSNPLRRVTLAVLTALTFIAMLGCSSPHSDEELIAALQSEDGPFSIASGSALSREDIDCITSSFVTGVGGAQSALEKYDLTLEKAAEYGFDDLQLSEADARVVVDNITQCAQVDELMFNIVGFEEAAKKCMRDSYSIDDLKEVGVVYFQRNEDLINNEKVKDLVKLLASCKGAGLSADEPESDSSAPDFQAAFEKYFSHSARTVRYENDDLACVASAVVRTVGVEALVKEHQATVQSIENGTFNLVLDEATASDIAEKQLECGQPIKAILSHQQYSEDVISCGVDKLDPDLFVQVMTAGLLGDEGDALIAEALEAIDSELVFEGCAS